MQERFWLTYSESQRELNAFLRYEYILSSKCIQRPVETTNTFKELYESECPSFGLVAGTDTWSSCHIFVTQVPTNWHKRAQLGIIAMLVESSFQACYAVGPIAQSVEQRTFNPWVDGSSPSGPTPTMGLNLN